MKRFLAILIITLISTAAIMAQESPDTDDSTLVASPIDLPIRVGIRGGVNLADMQYSNPAPAMSRYQHTMKLFPMGNLFFHLGFGKSGFSITPEVGITGKGVGLNWLDVDYDLAIYYLDIRMPLAFNFRIPGKPISPYIKVSPQVDLPFGGSIDYHAYDFPNGASTDISDRNVAPYDLSMTVGAGVDYVVNRRHYPIVLSLEAGYNLGLINTFATRENLDANGMPVADASEIGNPFFGAELWHDGRRSSGIEAAVRVSLPLNYQRPKPKEVEETPIPDIPYMIALPRPVLAPPVDTTPVLDTIIVYGHEYVKKDCYSLSEMLDFIADGTDLSDKRICMYNINFDFDSDKLRPESSIPLNEVVKMMKDYPEINIELYGHTDSIGSEEYNQNLSERRARSAQMYLVEHGIDSARITPIGFGLKLPIDTNETEDGRFRNRRVEIEILNIENAKPNLLRKDETDNTDNQE